MDVCFFCLFFNDTATTEIYTLLYTLSLHDALPISALDAVLFKPLPFPNGDRLMRRSEEHTSELQSHSNISYAVFCLKKKNNHTNIKYNNSCCNEKTHQYKTIKN